MSNKTETDVTLLKNPDVKVNTEPSSTVIIDESAHQYGDFQERTDYILDKFEYPRNGREPGLIIIFNQVHFLSDCIGTRTGSNRDVNEIIVCFSRLGFNVRSKYIFTDLTKTEIETAIQTILEEDLEQMNCIIVFFLTHGSTKNRLMTKDKPLSATSLWKKFSGKEKLKNKPKMFIFQACKGAQHMKSTDNLKKVLLVPYTTFSLDSMLPDTLIVFSSSEGSVSFRNGNSGSWFIQELCRNFSIYGRRDDVITLLVRTNKCVARNYIAEDGTQQMPVFLSTLNRMFYLNRNKERSSYLEYNQKNDDILNFLRDLNERVKEMKEFKIDEEDDENSTSGNT